MRVLSVVSEAVPLVKTGGLADVAGALPGALGPMGVEVTTLLPGYGAVTGALQGARAVWSGALMGHDARLLEGEGGGLDLLVLDAPALFAREGSIYLGPDGADWPDNPERFAALSQAAALVARGETEAPAPDLVHCHDWQAGLTPYYLRGSGIPTVMTVHNVAFHGLAPAERAEALGVDPADMHRDGVEFWGQLSALKAGLVHASHLTTVSPTYAAELCTPEFGMGLDGLFRARRGDLTGILNGIDTAVWDPAADAHAPGFKTPRGKGRARDALMAELGLPDAPGPLCVVVSRLTEQKGIDLLLQALPALVDQGGRLAVLGSGDRGLEDGLREAARHPHVHVTIGYDEALSHRLIAGGDAILVPSRFEPCGLTQLYGLRYGTLPVVGFTGGLRDTVIDASPMAADAGCATGLHVHPLTADALAQAFDRLCALYRDGDAWKGMQRNAMGTRVGWDRSARAYADLYARLIAAR
ncbi:MAG: glycogen synthase GlgA [Paracoccaceae bacterium]